MSGRGPLDLGPPELGLAVLALAALALAVAAARRYRSPLNPLTVHCVLAVGIYTVGSAWVALAPPVGSAPGSEFRAGAAVAAWVALVHLAGVCVPYLWHGAAPAWLFGQGMRALALDRLPPLRFQWPVLAVLLAIAVVAFVALALAGGGGSLWLTDPRRAYIGYRTGAGPFFVLTQWALLVAFAYTLWFRRPGPAGTLAWTGAFVGLAYFTGSKHNVLGLVALAICGYHFRVRRLSLVMLAALTPLVFTGAFVLLFVQGSYADVTGATSYFGEYFSTTAAFLARFEEFGFRWGGGWVSSLWFFVPRGLFPGKPFEYGETLIHQVLFPGAAARGNTPGLLPWSLSYLDFGVLGVFVTGWLQGMWQRGAFEYFLGHRENPFAFLLMVHFGLWTMFLMAPPVLLLAWLVLVALLLKARLSRAREVRVANSQRDPSGLP